MSALRVNVCLGACVSACVCCRAWLLCCPPQDNDNHSLDGSAIHVCIILPSLAPGAWAQLRSALPRVSSFSCTVVPGCQLDGFILGVPHCHGCPCRRRVLLLDRLCFTWLASLWPTFRNTFQPVPASAHSRAFELTRSHLRPVDHKSDISTTTIYQGARLRAHCASAHFSTGACKHSVGLRRLNRARRAMVMLGWVGREFATASGRHLNVGATVTWSLWPPPPSLIFPPPADSFRVAVVTDLWR